MNKRLKLHSKLEAAFPKLPIYYQPPANLTIRYPCIVYDLSAIHTNHADNSHYATQSKYTITLITPEADPDVDTLLHLPYSSFERVFVTQGLRHFVFTIYL